MVAEVEFEMRSKYVGFKEEWFYGFHGLRNINNWSIHCNLLWIQAWMSPFFSFLFLLSLYLNSTVRLILCRFLLLRNMNVMQTCAFLVFFLCFLIFFFIMTFLDWPSTSISSSSSECSLIFKEAKSSIQAFSALAALFSLVIFFFSSVAFSRAISDAIYFFFFCLLFLRAWLFVREIIYHIRSRYFNYGF